jgi:hypothetical protein
MTEAKIDANEFASQVEALLKEGLPLAEVGAARIYKDAPNDVTFTVYNFVDTVYWIPAQRTLIGSHWHGDVAASGIQFKIHPDNNRDHEFLVEPGHAYTYHGAGTVKVVSPHVKKFAAS